jgi:transposase InsO family protein
VVAGTAPGPATSKPQSAISNSMDASFCVDCLEDALRHHRKPEVFGRDQGPQFTSDAFTGVLKYEDAYLKGYANECRACC